MVNDLQANNSVQIALECCELGKAEEKPYTRYNKKEKQKAWNGVKEVYKARKKMII